MKKEGLFLKKKELNYKKVLTNNTKYVTIDTEREVMTMRTFYYEFTDGYICFTSGRMTKSDKAWEEHKHGKIVVERMV